MTGSYKGYKHEVFYKQNPEGAWYADISITRPDGTPLGPYAPTDWGANRDLEVIKNKAKDFIYSKIEEDANSLQNNPQPR